MFCPSCATQNIDEARFCRMCGTNISLVQQAIVGALGKGLIEENSRRRRRRGEQPPTIDRAVRSFFMGLAFIFVAFAAKTWAPAGNLWWFWLFIPAFSMIADGVSTYLKLRVLYNYRIFSINRIRKAPGTKLLTLVDFLFSPKTVEYTFKPIVADWQTEYFDALKEGRTKKARWISVRYTYRFILAMGLSKGFSLLKSFKSAIR